ncbi:MAG TPA: hypothetical protein VMV46_00590 [Thermoanaerobaculia bacterium]|nr:hypothetical protein [Thermoanaerobaculia bacterium]
MNAINDDTAQRLDLWLDGGPERSAGADLSDRLAADAELAAEERALRALFSQLESARVTVKPGFADGVMARLPRRRRAFSWVLAASLLVLFAAGGLGLLRLAGVGGSLGVLSALGDFVATSLVAGAGLLGATWSGVGAAVREWLGPSPVTWGIAAAVLVSLGLLLLSLVRRRVPALERSRSGRDDDTD